MRTEQDLRDALTFLADQAPGADEVFSRLHSERPAPAPARSRRVLVGAIVGLTVVAVGAVVLMSLRHRPLLEPADQRVSGRWAMISRFEPPAGWRWVTRTIAGNYEVTDAIDATGKGVCVVEVNRRGVQPHTPTPTGSVQPTVAVQNFPALYQATPGHAAVFWPYETKAWASVSCRLGPHGLGGASGPAALRHLILHLADSVTFGHYPLLLPIRLEQLPPGYTVQSATQDRFHPENWQITLTPTRRTPTTPLIRIGSVAGTVPKPNTSVGKRPASFFTEFSRGPRSAYPSYTNLCIPDVPVGICLSASNRATDDPASRQSLFRDLAGHIGYGASPTDTTTWFNATDALPG